ncbi:UNVERIFIED_CONTAM: putative bifunctional methylthioribulose-1-phosphate dehydratase/enolase-phosphatase E1, partial [Sesamum latifolium]
MAAASAAPFTINGAVKTQAYLEGSRVKETKALISELCRQFYHLGWESGTGGSITIKVHDDSIPKPHQLIVMSPSGVQKERMMEEDMYVLSELLPKPWPHKPPRCSDYGPLFLKAERYQHLFDAAINLYQLGLNWSTPSHGPIRSPNAVLGRHRNAKVSAKAGTRSPNNGTEPSRDDIKLLRAQGHIWRTGYQSNELETVVFNDVPEALEKWHSLGIKVYIYSSGSRLAQRLLFGNTNYGDLRKHLCGFFDTTVGNKKETKSYIEIMESLGVDNPSEILFVTDVYQEATAAKAA